MAKRKGKRVLQDAMDKAVGLTLARARVEQELKALKGHNMPSHEERRSRKEGA